MNSDQQQAEVDYQPRPTSIGAWVKPSERMPLSHGLENPTPRLVPLWIIPRYLPEPRTGSDPVPESLGFYKISENSVIRGLAPQLAYGYFLTDTEVHLVEYNEMTIISIDRVLYWLDLIISPRSKGDNR